MALTKSQIEVLTILKSTPGSYIESGFSDLKRVYGPDHHLYKKIVSKTFNGLIKNGCIDGQFPKFNITVIGRSTV